MTRVDDEDPVDPQFFRSVVGLLPTEVAIIGTHRPSGPFGMTVGTLVVGRVLDLSPHAEGDPLVFSRGGFHNISS
jgi:hypothetical protein